MDKSQKAAWVSSLKQVFDETTLVVVTHYSGLTVAEITELRSQLRVAGASFKVTKNRLTKLALAGTGFEGLDDLFNGPTAIAYSHDPVAAAKVAVKFAKDNDKLIILGGSFQGEALDVSGLNNLAKLPSLDELRAKLVGMISTPATRIVGVLNAPGSKLARVVGAKGAQSE